MSRRLWPLLAFALLQCRGAFVANMAVSQRRATTPALAAAQICMKKGRAQGGGCAGEQGRVEATVGDGAGEVEATSVGDWSFEGWGWMEES